VLRFEKQLQEAGVASKDDLEEVRAEVEKQVEEIVKFSDESPNPKADELYHYLYAGEWEPANA
jgi:pyruvate dehydrogenase E1 component alpha subunit